LVATLPMSDTINSTITADLIDPSAVAWLDRFRDNADDALNDLLLGQVWLGGYAAAELPQALPQFFPTELEEQLDNALQRWLALQRQRDALPEGTTAKQFARALADAFTLLQSMYCRAAWAGAGGMPVRCGLGCRASLVTPPVNPELPFCGLWPCYNRTVTCCNFGFRFVAKGSAPGPNLPYLACAACRVMTLAHPKPAYPWLW